MATNRIVTGQYVTLDQTPGSLADRVLGQLIDNIVIIAYSVVIYFVVYDNNRIQQLDKNTYTTLMFLL